jgi:AcrR family transcriptional regulator
MLFLHESGVSLVGMEATPGLRERKKQRTREAIVESAFELFAERGFDGTTIADIAEAAEIAPRTFFSYFPSKDDVVFHDFEERHEMVASWLRDREPGTNAIDALRAGIARTFTDSPEETEPAHLAEKRLCARLIRENETLAAHSQFLKSKFAELLAEAVAEDLGDEPGDLRPRLVAAAGAAAMGVLEDLPEDDGEHSRETIESLLAFLRGGLAALQEQGSEPS